MAQWSRSGDREVLDRKLTSARYELLLHRIQETSLFFRQFDSWSAVIAFMRRGTSQDPAKDEALRPLFAARRTASDERWDSILLAIFFPGLEAMWRRRASLVENPDELWTEVTWSFLHAISNINPERRQTRIVQKIINDTHHHFRASLRSEWERERREPAHDPEELELLADATMSTSSSGSEVGWAIRRLRRHLTAGRLNEIDFYLLVGTVIYDRPLAACATELGLTPEAAKKRRQRALAAIRPYEPRD